jgi:CheY-like chemotaxis protein
VLRDDKTSAMRRRPGPAGAPRRLGRATILLVDGDPQTLERVSRLLEAEGATVRTATRVSDALAQMRERTPDVLVSELTLPPEDGFAFIRAVRRDPTLQRTPAIALTGDSRFASSITAEDAGFDRLFVKPADDELLIVEMVRMLGVRRRAAGA